MIVTLLREPPNGDLAVELREFERQFRYPLDQGWFRIDHGDDYNRFYRSQGQSVYVIARDDSGILGVCSATKRELHRPGMPNQSALYLGDLKIAVRARGGSTLLRLANAVRSNFSDVSCAYSVVMNGTRRTPDQYTGRAGLPGFAPVGHLRIWRLPTAPSSVQRDRAVQVSPAEGEALFRHLSEDQYFSLSGDPHVRSSLPVQWWVAKDQRACGRLEDTRRAKQLFRDDGEEMVSAHLAAFAYSEPASAGGILDAARDGAASAGIPALFLARPDSGDALPAVLEQLAEGAVASNATIYAAGIDERSHWNIFTSEI
jgi:hypothetical protein